MSRKSARAAAVQMVYEQMLGGEGGEETLRGLIEFTPEEDDQAYINSLLKGVADRAEELDGQIEKCLKGWTLDRLSRVDLAIMRLAAWELMLGEDPTGAIINEAVELANQFSTDKAGGFVNGVLGNLARALDDAEAKA